MTSQSIKYIIVADKPSLFEKNNDRIVVTPHEFITNSNNLALSGKNLRVINLSSNYDYASRGYYVSLLSEAYDLNCIPSVSNIVSLNWRRNHAYSFSELNAILEKTFDIPYEEPLVRSYTSFFGRHNDPKIEPLARRIFDIFRFPIVSFEIKYTNKKIWNITNITPVSLNNLVSEQLSVLHQDIAKFTGSAWGDDTPKTSHERYWLAILHNPQEEMPPSNSEALQKFIDIGKQMSIWVELITKDDFASILEYDAIFIRETTAINNHTYRFAQKAELEGIPVIDDTRSMIRCCNKIYLNELMEIHHINKPYSVLLDKKSLDSKINQIDLPSVLKIPDGSFSTGVFKVSTQEELRSKALTLLKKSDIILCQEFLPTEFDWRIGVLDNKPLFATKYYMAEGHWQIYNHGENTIDKKYGNAEAVSFDDVPSEVIDIAISVSKLIGDGLYGVDIKQLPDGRVVVIEVNDNPNIDFGIEDAFLGDEIYKTILSSFIERIDA